MCIVQSHRAYRCCRASFSMRIRESGSPLARSGRSNARPPLLSLRNIVSGLASRHTTKPPSAIDRRFSARRTAPPPVETTTRSLAHAVRIASFSRSRKSSCPPSRKISRIDFPAARWTMSSVSAISQPSVPLTIEATAVFPAPENPVRTIREGRVTARSLSRTAPAPLSPSNAPAVSAR